MTINILISALIILGCFIGVVILILTNALNRAIAALLGAIITYFTLIFIEKMNYSVVADLLFGSSADGFANLHALILIMGMMMIVQISNDAGVFQFLAIKLVQMTKGRPVFLMITFCGISVLISALLNNLLAVIILIPLTIMVSRILNVNPAPYILTQSILVHIGGTIFIISAIPNILITSYAGISFVEFFLNAGIMSIIIAGITILFFIFIYKNELVIPRRNLDILLEFNAWNVVPNKSMLYKSSGALILVMILYLIVPESVLPPDAIAITVAIVLILITKMNPREIIKKIDIELMLYLLGIFVIVDALDTVGVINVIGNALSNFNQNNELGTILFVLWISSLLSGIIDNIPVTKVMIPVVGIMTHGAPLSTVKMSYYSLAIGVNWGDNLTPMGDNIVAVNIAEQNKRPINMNQFFKLGFVTAIIQLLLVSLYFVLLFQFWTGLMILSTIIAVILVLYFIYRIDSKKNPSKMVNIINRFRRIFLS